MWLDESFLCLLNSEVSHGQSNCFLNTWMCWQLAENLAELFHSMLDFYGGFYSAPQSYLYKSSICCRMLWHICPSISPSKLSLSKNFQWQTCSTINYLSNGINIFAGDDPVPVKFGPKGTDPQQEGCTFHISHTVRCAVSYSRPSCSFTDAGTVAS